MTQKKTPPGGGVVFEHVLDGAGRMPYWREFSAVRFKEEFKEWKISGGAITTDSDADLPIQ